MRHQRTTLLALVLLGIAMPVFSGQTPSRAPRVEPKPSVEKDSSSLIHVDFGTQNEIDKVMLDNVDVVTESTIKVEDPSAMLFLKPVDIAHGYTIEKSGYYILSSPCRLNDENIRAAISIKANNVVLDLNHQTLSSENVDYSIDGIEVAEGHNNVVIKNGKLIGFSGNGITILSNTEDVTIKNMVIRACRGSGLVSHGSATHSNKDLLIAHSTFSNNRNAGASFSETENVRMYNIRCNDNRLSGAIVINGSNYEISNSFFCGNHGHGDVAGLELVSVHASTIKRCSFSANSSSSGDVYGLVMKGSGNSVEFCVADNNSGAATSTGIAAWGSSHTLSQCTAKANVSGDKGIGFYLHADTKGCYVTNCRAIGNSTIGFKNEALYAANLFCNNVSFGHGVDSNYSGEGIGYVVMGIAAQQACTNDKHSFDNISIV
jgi:hypothetical protein